VTTKPQESRSEHCSIRYARIPRKACSNLDHASKNTYPEQAIAWVSEASDEAALPLQGNVLHHISTSFSQSSRMNLTQQNCQIFFGMYPCHDSYIRGFQDFQTKSLSQVIRISHKSLHPFEKLFPPPQRSEGNQNKITSLLIKTNPTLFCKM